MANTWNKGEIIASLQEIVGGEHVLCNPNWQTWSVSPEFISMSLVQP